MIDGGRNFYCPSATVTMARLPELRPEVLYLFGGKSVMSPLQKREDILRTTGTGLGGSGGVARGAVESQVLAEWGHLLPFESPNDCAEAIASYVSSTPVQKRDRTSGSSFDPYTMQFSANWQARIKKAVDATITQRKGNKL